MASTEEIPEQPAADVDDAAPALSFPVVGIGASAGGLEALTALIKGVTCDSMAFVVQQHLSPTKESLLPELLRRVSHIPVVAIADGMKIEPNHIYVAPPAAEVGLLHGVLHLMSPTSTLPIDRFFRALAEDLGPKAVGVVLSGMGHDGTQGVKEIKARGGLVFAQDSESAKFDSMPNSARDTGVVDRVLPPESIASELMTMSKHPYLARKTAGPLPPEREALSKLFIMIRSAFGNDLSLYKPTTISRRVERRMALHTVQTLPDYVRYVNEHEEELAALYSDILISVTSFFRDVEPFEILKKLILPRMLERKSPGSPIRMWVPACSSGEEAYSLGISLLEALDETSQSYRIQIFGTDVDEDAIARARRGTYPSNIEADVSKERLERFFVRVGDNYQVSRRLRDLLVFSPQNLTNDSPFSRIDLASCRNLLIYLQPPLQKKVLRVLHYALRPDGILMLGGSETVGDCADLFSLIDRKNKIYQKKNLPLAGAFDPRTLAQRKDEPLFPPERDRRTGMTAQQLADRKLVERYSPPSVLVNENLDVLQFRGDTGPYLSPAPGTATLNLLKLLRPELHVEVWRVIQQVMKTNLPGKVPALRLARGDGGGGNFVEIAVLPIHEVDSNSQCMLIVFEDRTTASLPSPSAASTDPGSQLPEAEPLDPSVRVHELEQDLAATKDYLQTTVEELEASNEELKSTNEELQSTNEELQSSNEELETSREELQSTNEELSTMNDELQHRMGDLARTSSDLDNLLVSVREPVLLVDGDLRVRRASDAARHLFRLEPGDLGRPLAQVSGMFVGLDIEQTARQTISRLVATTESGVIGGKWHEVRTMPYRSTGGVVDGVLIIVNDVDAEHRRRDLVLDVEAYAAKLLSALPQPLAIVDAQLRVLWVSETFLATFHVASHDTLGNLFQNLGTGQWAHPRLREAMEASLASGAPFRDFRIEHEFEAIGRRVVLVSGSAIRGVGGADRVLLLTIVPQDGTVVVGGA